MPEREVEVRQLTRLTVDLQQHVMREALERNALQAHRARPRAGRHIRQHDRRHLFQAAQRGHIRNQADGSFHAPRCAQGEGPFHAQLGVNSVGGAQRRDRGQEPSGEVAHDVPEDTEPQAGSVTQTTPHTRPGPTSAVRKSAPA